MFTRILDHMFGYWRNRPPLEGLFWEIVRSKYILHKNDCSNKAARYCMALHEAGYDHAVVVIVDKDFSDNTNHAVVYVNNVYYDLTNGGRSKSPSKWGKIVRIVNNHELGKGEWAA